MTGQNGRLSVGDPVETSVGVSTGDGSAAAARGTWTFPLVLTAVFFVVALVNVLTHEMWSDELDAWLVARDADGLADMFHNLRYEGHPGLWHLGLYAITRFALPPEAMQVYHVLIAAAAVFVFARWSPFTRLVKTLFVFGYFPLYEYATVSRNYALGVLFLFVFCALAAPGRRKNYVLLAIPLFLMAQANAYALLVAGSLAGMLIVEAWCDRDVRASLAARKVHLVAAVVIFLAGAGLSAYQILPPADSDCYAFWRTGFYPGAAARVAASAWYAYVPIPQLTTRFWNTNIVPSLAVQGVLGVMLLVAGAWLFRRPRPVLFLYLCFATAMMSLQYLKFFGGMRHLGHLFLVFVACLWLTLRAGKQETSEDPSSRRDNATWTRTRFAGGALIVFFGMHMAVGLTASAIDWFCAFSPGKDAAEYIHAQGLLDTSILAGCERNRMCPIVGYLNTRYFSPYGCRWGSFPIYTTAAKFDLDRFYRRLAEMQTAQQKDVLLVLTPGESAPPHYEKIADFPPTILPDGEHYILYLLRYKPPDNTPSP